MNRDVRVNGVPINSCDSSTRSRQPDVAQKVRDILGLLKQHYLWFVVSVIICLSIAVYRVGKSPDIYLRITSIMIKDGEHGASNISVFKDLGIETPSRNVMNEIMVIKSADVAREVVRRLGLDMEYRREGLFVNPVVYGDNVPIKVLIPGIDDFTTMSCTLELMADSMVRMSDIVRNGMEIDDDFSMKLGAYYETVIGTVAIVPTDSYNKGIYEKLMLQRSSISTVSNMLTSNINANLRSRDATIIDIYYIDESIERANDILDAVVEEYNRRWVNDQNLITESTNKFINERIAAIEKELSEVESTLANYRSSNLTLDADAQGEKALYRVEKADDRLIEIENQMYMIEYMRSFIDNPDNERSLLPLNTGINSASIEHYLAEYNTVMQTRNGHLAHASSQSPVVSDLTERLNALKSTISHTMDNELIRLSNEYDIVNDRKINAQVTVANTPHKTIYLTSIERQKQVKENLYLFLLQKKEENELSRTFTAYNCRLVEPPHGSTEPISPNPEKSCLLAILAGLSIPLLVVVMKESMNGKVRTKSDIEWLDIPFMGEIPLSANVNRELKKKRIKSLNNVSVIRKEKLHNFVVMPHCRDMMNEAFRMLRTNIEFMLSGQQCGHIVMVTSLNPASGKTFIAANLALSLSLADKRVVLVDLDMRKGMLSRYVVSGIDGMSSYLSGRMPDYHSLIINRQGLDIMPCGIIPPNPIELLIKDTFPALIESLRDEYDYVIIDAPPVELVADAAIINQYVDLTLFVVRAHLHEKAHLPILDTWYTKSKYRNLAIVLNGTTVADSVYGRHGYGYC